MRLIKSIRDNPDILVTLKKIYVNNPIEFINDWCITYDPRAKKPNPKTMPFILFPKQEQMVLWLQDCLKEGEGGLCEKTRDMGATWVACAFSIWLWLFVGGASIGWGSRKESLVDKIGDPDSIFEKMRMILRYLPEFMLPRGFDVNKHATYMKIVNPTNGSTITGESGDNIGRGGRSLLYIKDEAAHYERPELIEAALADNTDVQIDISSVWGTNNVFYKRRVAGQLWEAGEVMPKNTVKVFVMDWRDHPNKNQEWYDGRYKQAEAEGLLHILAQEVDRDYSASVDRVIIPAIWIRAAIDADRRLNISDEGDKTLAMDVADEGGDKNAVAIRYGVNLKHCEAWGEGDTGYSTRRAINLAHEWGTREFYYDAIGVGAGVKAETNRLRADNSLHGMIIMPWNASAKPLEPDDNIILNDFHSPTNGEFFQNLKAQAWWNLRNRFYKTWQAVEHGVHYEHDELISLDSDIACLPQLVMELSQPTQKYSGTGKLMVDKKPDGGKSPNLADCLAMVYTPTREVSILDVL